MEQPFLNGDDDKLITIDEVNNKKPVRFASVIKMMCMQVNIKNLGLDGIKFCYKLVLNVQMVIEHLR